MNSAEITLQILNFDIFLNVILFCDASCKTQSWGIQEILYSVLCCSDLVLGGLEVLGVFSACDISVYGEFIGNYTHCKFRIIHIL